VQVETHEELKAEKGQLQKNIQSVEMRIRVKQFFPFRVKKMMLIVRQEAQGRVNEWKGKAATSRNKVDEAKASQSENRTNNRVLDSLTRQSQSGKVAGFHVRKIGLNSTPYDLSTLGPTRKSRYNS